MPVFRCPLVLLLILAFGLPALAAEAPRRRPPAEAAQPHRGTCLSKAEQRAAVASHRAVPLGRALQKLRARGHRAELVGARLCRRGNGLVYVLTFLARSGKVIRTTIDAANGELITGR